MTIEEKQKEIEKYCDRHVCNKYCVLLDLHIDDFCYREKDCKLIDEMYDKLKINERYSAEIKEKMKNTDKGCMTIKGTCYEDVLNILCRNGYKTNMITEPSNETLGNIEHIIVFWKE